MFRRTVLAAAMLITVLATSRGVAQQPGIQMSEEETMMVEDRLIRTSVISILQTIKQYPQMWSGALDDDNNPFRSMELTDEANLLLRDFVRSCNKPQNAETDKEQADILAKLDKTVMLAKHAEARKAAAEKAKTAKANPPAKKPDTTPPTRNAAADTTPPRPANPDAPPPIPFDQNNLVVEPRILNAPEYKMPAKLTSEEARDLIVRTDNLPKKFERLQNLTTEHGALLRKLVDPSVQARFWNRIVNKEGFKDSTIASDWSNYVLDNTGFLVMLETVFQTIEQSGSQAFVLIKIRNVQLNIIGSRITWGDQAFVNAADGYVSSTITKLEKDIEFLTRLIERCETEGTIKYVKE